ncbi:MAG: FHA domain-containing protein, partial [Planctomycetota bacterium]|nr:FHA domain-containing protein [Planctomycetota bacterium]
MGILTLHGDAAKKEFVISNSRPVFIGRVADSEICLPSPAVSRQHAVLIERNGVCGIKDLGSVNGTYVNGTRIQNSIRLVNG